MLSHPDFKRGSNNLLITSLTWSCKHSFSTEYILSFSSCSTLLLGLLNIIMNWWRLFGYANTSFHHSPNPIELQSVPDRKRTNLAEFCKAVTPTCRLNPFLFNGHLQTFWTAVKSQDIPIYYKRKIFEAEDPTFAGIFAVDFVVSPYHETDESLPPRTTHYNDTEIEDLGCLDTKPMLITLHGLSGGSHEIYLRSVLEPVLQEGWEACVINSRGCANSSITSGVLYNARATWDIRQVVKWLRKKFPNRPLFGIGYSLGANILVNVRIVDKLRQLYTEVNLIMVPLPVSWRRRVKLCIESSRSMFKPLEFGDWINSTPANLAWVGGILEGDGI